MNGLLAAGSAPQRLVHRSTDVAAAPLDWQAAALGACAATNERSCLGERAAPVRDATRRRAAPPDAARADASKR
jgi:hypothetical protein